jgi:hypothetical protein
MQFNNICFEKASLDGHFRLISVTNLSLSPAAIPVDAEMTTCKRPS